MKSRPQAKPQPKWWHWSVAALAFALAIFMGVRASAPSGQSVSEPIAAGATPVIDEDPVAPVSRDHSH